MVMTQFPVARAFLRCAQDRLCPCCVTAKMAVPRKVSHYPQDEPHARRPRCIITVRTGIKSAV
jgi:hypothetical protein